MKNEPIFCSPGMADGEYDYVLKLIEEYKKGHPDEHVTLKLMGNLERASFLSEKTMN